MSHRRLGVKRNNGSGSAKGSCIHIQTNVKQHAPLSAGASADHGVEVKTTEDHVNRAADRGCCVSTCSAVFFLLALELGFINGHCSHVAIRNLVKGESQGGVCCAAISLLLVQNELLGLG